MTIQPVDEHQLADVVEVPHRDDVAAGRRTRRTGSSASAPSRSREKIAPATKYGGKIVECQPGSDARSRSRDDTIAVHRDHERRREPGEQAVGDAVVAPVRAEPRQPSANMP